jgi:arabinan endo-1,5-alpha-L-arabinosidase
MGLLSAMPALGQMAPAVRAHSAATTSKSTTSTATYTNPVLDTDFPDPTLIRARDGYYAYATQNKREGKVLNLQVARSPDLVQWTQLDDALPVKPTWADTTQQFWAPHVSEAGGTYYLYFSAKPNTAPPSQAGVGERGLCLAVATATSPAGPFKPAAEPLQCGPSFVNIDPMQFDDPATGKKLLYWGSGFGPIKVRELAADRISFAPGSTVTELVKVIPTDTPEDYQRLVEGAWVVLRNGWYYLFYSGDNCCGDKAHYAVMVARSRNATGPFQTLAEATRRPNSVVLERNARWLAPGHNSVVTDARGQDWMAYHAIDTGKKTFGAVNTEQGNSRRIMLLDRLEYVDGWPRIVPNKGTPSVSAQPAPARRPH